VHPLRAVFVLAVLIVLAACSTAHRMPGPSSPESVATRGAPGDWSAGVQDVVLERQQLAPYLVRRGWLDLTVAAPPATAARAQEITLGLTGLVQTATVSEDEAKMVLRVPEPRLDEALDQLSTLGEVDSRRLSADDVTEQVIDLEARVASLVAVRDRLRAMLDRSAEVSEIMSVERELARVQAEIDAIEGRLRHLRSRAVMAELSLSARRERKLGILGVVAVGVGKALGWLFIRE
jgi:hypothetical protein